MEHPINETNTLVLSYLEMRRAVGYLGIGLPFVVSLGGLIIFGDGFQDSISGYYYTGMRNVFVGSLWAIGVFLLSYKGYERKDAIAGNLACLLAIGVALFPVAPHTNPSPQQEIIGHIHLGFASLFFASLAYFSLCLFTKTDPEKTPSPRKIYRNSIYRTCGYAMVSCLILIVVIHIVLAREANAPLGRWGLVFWLESIAIVAFGISWMTKGGAILKDVEE
jgi:hypothetical protein